MINTYSGQDVLSEAKVLDNLPPMRGISFDEIPIGGVDGTVTPIDDSDVFPPVDFGAVSVLVI